MTWLVMLGVLALMIHPDPAPGMGRTKTRSRQLDCERLSAEEGELRYPGEIVRSKPRGDYVERDAMVCKERLMRAGLRDDLDEAVLMGLDETVGELAVAARSGNPELEVRTWLVEVSYPNMQVASKISFAAKDALVAQGLSVSDRSPRLGAGDVDVLSRLPPERAYPAACQRYGANGSIDGDDVVLLIMHLDERETALHAGLCEGGSWRWLQ